MKRLFTIAATALLALAACNHEPKADEQNKTKMSEDSPEIREEQNKKAALACLNALMAGDIDGTLKDAAKDVADFGDGEVASVTGVDSLKAGLKLWRASMSEYKGNNLLAVADGEWVTVIGDWTVKFASDFMGRKVAGKSFTMKDVDYFRFNSDGKITEHHNIQSWGPALARLEQVR